MTMHVALPRWTDLIAAALKPLPDEDALSEPWRIQGRTTVWYSRGAWVLAAVAEQIAQANDGAPPHFWIPDYFCNQSTAALRETNAKLIFYPVDENLSPDWPRCDALADEIRSDVFLAVHFFGRPADMARARVFCDANDALLFEDAAHVLRPLAGMATEADISLFCPHKSLPIPDGAVLIERHAGTCPAPSGRAPGVGGWMAKRALQKLTPAGLLRSRNRRQAPPYAADPEFLRLPATPMMSASAQRILMRAQPHLAQVDAARRRHAGVLRKTIDKMGLALTPVFGTEGEEGFAPYRLVLKAQSPTAANDAYGALVEAGFPVGTWPDLPPEVTSNPTAHEWALHFRQHLIFLPVFSGVI
jgi:hypothetical protein